jgi:23S rRNA (cytidine1920-2'-O)/16S rRNA (cytidine1409-2'-O)-methyltransferase
VAASRQQLDTLLVDRGLAADRTQARALIMAGRVRGEDRRYTKPGLHLPADTPLSVSATAAYVSRGGEKLSAALATWPIDLDGRVCLDVGASTGGFSDCLLQRGAARVFAVDVGYGQLASSLRDDQRVTVMERTHVRDLPLLDPAPSLLTLDVAFISARATLEAAAPRLAPDSDALVLVKPQFEAPREAVDHRGVVADPTQRAAAVASVLAWARQRGWRLGGVLTSPLVGPAGNREFFCWLRLPANPGDDS